MNILLICGSTRKGSYSQAAVRAAAAMLESKGAKICLWDLGVQRLPIADPEYHDRPRQHPLPIVQELVAAADAADAFVLGSPVYHNSYSGVLKNCLDHLTISQFAYKPVGLISFGTTHTAVQACDHLRIVTRGLYGLAIPSQVVTVRTDFSNDEFGDPKLTNPQILKRLDAFATELMSYCRVRSAST